MIRYDRGRDLAANCMFANLKKKQGNMMLPTTQMNPFILDSSRVTVTAFVIKVKLRFFVLITGK